MEHHPFCFRMYRSSVEEMDGPYHVAGKRSSQTLDWRIREAINPRKEKHLKNHRGEGVIVQSEVDAPEPPLPSRPPSPKMSKLFELPDKYKTLNNLFAEMECSIRWLALQNQLPTFQNICAQMERQTNKKFLISHLAQMKYVFPEAIVLETILAHDKRTLCMKPEIKVTLLIKAKSCSMFPAHSPSQALWQAFRTKLLELSLTMPEGGEIPEAVLPYPFNRESYYARYNDPKIPTPSSHEELVKKDDSSSHEELVKKDDKSHRETLLTPSELVKKDDKSHRETLLTPSFSKSSVLTEAGVPDILFCEIEQKFFWAKDPPSKLQLREETDADADFSNRPPSAASVLIGFNREFQN